MTAFAECRRRWPALGGLTLLTYNTWLWWKPLNGDARIFDGYLSELSAADQPHHAVFRGGDLITGLIVVALGVRTVVLLRRSRPPRARWWWVAGIALLVFGLSSMVDASVAMDCAPILNESCQAAEERGQLSTAHYAHTYSSVGAQAGIVVSMGAAYVAMRRSRLGIGRAQGTVLTLGVIEVLALTVMMIMLAAGLPGLGYPQVVTVLVASLWFAAVGLGLLGADPGSGVRRFSPKDEYAS